jgi:hypothetical protein
MVLLHTQISLVRSLRFFCRCFMRQPIFAFVCLQENLHSVVRSRSLKLCSQPSWHSNANSQVASSVSCRLKRCNLRFFSSFCCSFFSFLPRFYLLVLPSFCPASSPQYLSFQFLSHHLLLLLLLFPFKLISPYQNHTQTKHNITKIST